MIYFGFQSERKRTAIFATGAILFSFSLDEISIHTLYSFINLPQGERYFLFLFTFGIASSDDSNLLGKLR